MPKTCGLTSTFFSVRTWTGATQLSSHSKTMSTGDAEMNAIPPGFLARSSAGSSQHADDSTNGRHLEAISLLPPSKPSPTIAQPTNLAFQSHSAPRTPAITGSNGLRPKHSVNGKSWAYPDTAWMAFNKVVGVAEMKTETPVSQIFFGIQGFVLEKVQRSFPRKSLKCRAMQTSTAHVCLQR